MESGCEPFAALGSNSLGWNRFERDSAVMAEGTEKMAHGGKLTSSGGLFRTGSGMGSVLGFRPNWVCLKGDVPRGTIGLWRIGGWLAPWTFHVEQTGGVSNDLAN